MSTARLFRAFAKVNLTLEVVRRREDGYHELVSLVHAIDLADDLRVEPHPELTVDVEGMDADEDNLVTRAAGLLGHATGTAHGARLTLVKRIPVAAGLGGGSSDAATTLVSLNRLWGTRLGTAALAELALQLGSDVPFFGRGGAALLRGRGDRVEQLPPLDGRWLVLAVPAIELPDKTARLYRALQPDDFSSGEHTLAVAARLPSPPDQQHLRNAFERAARVEFPGLDALWRSIEAACERHFSLSGAGPTLFSLVASHAEGRAVAHAVERTGVRAIVVRTVRRGRASVRLNVGAAIRYDQGDPRAQCLVVQW